MTDNFRDNEDRHRFELDVGGKIAFVAYRKSPGAITLVHTVVPPELGGQGIGSRLGRATLGAVPTTFVFTLRNGGHASAFALQATADKSLCPPYARSRLSLCRPVRA